MFLAMREARWMTTSIQCLQASRSMSVAACLMLDLSIITRYDVVRFDEVTDLDNELFHIRAVGSYAGSRLTVNGLVSYDEKSVEWGRMGMTIKKGN